MENQVTQAAEWGAWVSCLLGCPHVRILSTSQISVLASPPKGEQKKFQPLLSSTWSAAVSVQRFGREDTGILDPNGRKALDDHSVCSHASSLSQVLKATAGPQPCLPWPPFFFQVSFHVYLLSIRPRHEDLEF